MTIIWVFFCLNYLDVRAINDHAINAKSTGLIILGGGLVKHHTCNANMMVRLYVYEIFNPWTIYDSMHIHTDATL